MADLSGEGRSPQQRQLARQHLRFGWWSLVLFVATGLVLEAMHGLKVSWYLDVGNETRRLMWTLGHAHGTLLSLLNVAFGLAVLALPTRDPRRQALASRCLLAATVVLPAGFFLGGVAVYGGDPGLGVLLTPLGGLLLLAGVLLTAWGAGGPD